MNTYKAETRTDKNAGVIKRGLVVGGMMPINKWAQISSIDLPFAIPPMPSDCANQVHFCVRKRGIDLSMELPFKGLNSGLAPVLRF